MKGIALTTLLILLFVCQTNGFEVGEISHISTVEYGIMKEFFERWNAKPDVQSIGIPKAFNWIIKRQLKKETESPIFGRTFIRSIIDGIENISLLEYARLEENESLNLEEELDRIAGYDSERPDFCIILSGKNEKDGSFSRLVFHSKESKALIILKGKFLIDI